MRRRRALRAENERLRSEVDDLRRGAVDELVAENDRLRRATEALTDLTFDSFQAAVEDGTLFAQFQGGTTERVSRVIAWLGLMLLDASGEPEAPNYREGSAEVEAGGVVLAFAACRSAEQTPHRLRERAEADARRLLGVLADAYEEDCGLALWGREPDVVARIEELRPGVTT